METALPEKGIFSFLWACDLNAIESMAMFQQHHRAVGSIIHLVTSKYLIV